MSTIKHSGTAYNARTYGKRLSEKRKKSLDTNVRPRKRPRSSAEPDEPNSQPSSPVVKTRTRSPSPLRSNNNPSKPQLSTPTLVRDLSSVFRSYSPKGPFPLTPTPTKLASRMLARSKTETSIESSKTRSIERTPSLPNLPSSSSLETLTLSAPSQPYRAAPSTTNTRTYAGKSRSFLVSIPASSLHNTLADEDDDEFSRESYASLRSRWGVDNSEDDPYLDSFSPSHSSIATTPSGTPSKPRGRKARRDANIRDQLSLPNGLMNPLKSITELRSKGENRRFLDEVGYLFEGLNLNAGVGLRRASALEISTKLCDAEFSRKAKAADFHSKAWDILVEAGAGEGRDKVFDTIFVFFVALIARDPTALRDLALRPSFSSPESSARSSRPKYIPIQSHSSFPSLVDVLFKVLDTPTDLLLLISSASHQEKARNEVELKKIGLEKKDREILQAIHDTIVSKSSLFPSKTIISTSLLIIYTLQNLPHTLISQRYFPPLLNSLHRNLSPIIASNSGSGSPYLSWLDKAPTVPFENLYFHIHLLDLYLLGQWGSSEAEQNLTAEDDTNETKLERNNDEALAKAKDEWLMDGLVALGLCAERVGDVLARKCIDVTFRVLVSLTHTDPNSAQKVIDMPYAMAFTLRTILKSDKENAEWIRKSSLEINTATNESEKGKAKAKVNNDELSEYGEDELGGHVLDTLCLALGLLTNLVQVAESTKDLLRDFRIDPSCTLKKRSCVRSCTCPHPISGLDVIIRLYTNCCAQLESGTPQDRSAAIKTEELDLVGHLNDPRLDSDMVFLRGHIAILFGLLIRGSATNQEYILDALGGLSALQRLTEYARTFVAFYRLALSGGTLGTRDEGKVAKDVVAFLESIGKSII